MHRVFSRSCAVYMVNVQKGLEAQLSQAGARYLKMEDYSNIRQWLQTGQYRINLPSISIFIVYLFTQYIIIWHDIDCIGKLTEGNYSKAKMTAI